MIAPYAVQLQNARGRLYKEEEGSKASPFCIRAPWQRDRDRVLHSTGFRTLQYKTQVFLNHEGDFFRTRLTHSLEVAQISRSVARNLGVNEDLTEVIALAHDLGHTPFGHAGEDALSEAMEGWGGFSHNAQSLRLVTEVETRYHGFNGLNLTWETLEGLAKHHGPVKKPSAWLVEFDEIYPLDLKKYASTESQIAAICDDIAYHGHDLDDGLRAGLITFDDLEEVPLLKTFLDEVRTLDWSCYEPLDRDQRLRHELVRRVINALISDLTGNSLGIIKEINPQTVDDVRNAGKAIVALSADMEQKNKEVRKFLYQRMYRHWRVMRMARKARLALKEIFSILSEEPRLLPSPWREKALIKQERGDEGGCRRIIADYIASMSDRNAMEEHKRLTDLSVIV